MAPYNIHTQWRVTLMKSVILSFHYFLTSFHPQKRQFANIWLQIWIQHPRNLIGKCTIALFTYISISWNFLFDKVFKAWKMLRVNGPKRVPNRNHCFWTRTYQPTDINFDACNKEKTFFVCPSSTKLFLPRMIAYYSSWERKMIVKQK